jgi:hypothetical protein
MVPAGRLEALDGCRHQFLPYRRIADQIFGHQLLLLPDRPLDTRPRCRLYDHDVNI